MMKFVIHPAIELDRFEALKAAGPAAASWVNAETLDVAREAMPGVDAFLGKITPDLLEAAGPDRPRWVQSFTASLEHYMFQELVEHSCILTNTRGLFGDVIADQVMGYVLCFARNLHRYVRNQIEHRYEPMGGESARVNNAFGPGTINNMDRATIYLPESRLGVFGMGGIGAEVARRALAFGMTVRGVDRYPDRVTAPAEVEAVWPFHRLPDLVAWSDFLVIAAPHTPETAGLFDKTMLAHFRPDSFLINIGRGAIVVLDDLVGALEAGRLRGAALDVYEVEPLPADHPLWDFPDVILTPHTAGYSTAVAGRHLATLVENIRRFGNGQPLANVVDKRLWF